MLVHNGFRIVDHPWREPTTRVEIDLVVDSPEGQRIWVEATGSWESDRNSLERTDTMLKKIATATMIGTLDKHPPYWLIVSHPPKPGSSSWVWLNRTRHLWSRVLHLNPPFLDADGTCQTYVAPVDL
jgi:hypothetical protein